MTLAGDRRARLRWRAFLIRSKMIRFSPDALFPPLCEPPACLLYARAPAIRLPTLAQDFWQPRSRSFASDSRGHAFEACGVYFGGESFVK